MILRQGVAYFIFKAIPAVISVLTLSMLSRYMGPDLYGKYSLILLSASFLSLCIYQWLNLSVGRMFHIFLLDKREIFFINLAIKLSIIVLLISLFLSILIDILFPDKSYISIPISIVCVLSFSQSWNELILRVFNAGFKVNSYGKIAILKAFMTLAALYLVLKLELGLIALVVSVSASNILSTIFFMRFSFINFTSVEFLRDELLIIKNMINYGLPLSISAILVFLIDIFARFFIRVNYDDWSVGLFSIPYDITQFVIGSLMMIVNLTLFPNIIRSYEDSNGNVDGVKKALQSSFNTLFFFLAPIVVGFIMVVESFSHLFVGKDYINDFIILSPVIAVSLFFSCLKSFYFDYAFHLTMNAKAQLFVSFASALCSLLVFSLFVKYFGVVGAAYGALVSFFIAMLLSMIVGKIYFEMPNVEVSIVFKIVISCVLMAIVMSQINCSLFYYELFLRFIFGVLVYIFSMLLLNLKYCKDKFYKCN
ncbi:TPA: polysaccharide biosynthesis C-terminal domain-containing protein [Aeromonas hydrophila]